MFQGAQKVDIGGNARFMSIAGKKVTTVVNHWHDENGTHGLESLKGFVSFSAQFDSSSQDPERICHPGTRQHVLKHMKDWIDDPNSTDHIFWLHGPAGAGKSAIAQTIAHSYDRTKVAATFFFFRSDANRNDGNLLFTTLAYQLAFSIPAMKEHIAQSLHEYPDLPTKSLEKQFHHLIALPFQSLTGEVFNQCQQLAPIIIIDGIDECTKEKLQQRFLKIIGDAVKNRIIPFRFLICSRPEAHIEEALNKFETFIVPVNLAKLDGANRDIGKYLMDKFYCIASNRGLGPTWPGPAVIQEIIYKSSGNFIFASVVIRFVSDEDSMPEDQLAIILNLRPPEGRLPFAVLDELYLEILRRQIYQDFVKTFLSLLVGRTTLAEYGNLNKDDAKVMNVSEEELRTKLRRMRSLLKLEPYIDVHHRSFLDFLNDLSRSGVYYVSKQAGTRRYMELVIDSITRYVSRVIEKPDRHKIYHFNLRFLMVIDDYSFKINLPIEELQDMLRPLVQIQDEVLKLSDSRISDLQSCSKCNVSNLMRYFLLHLAIHRCINAAYDKVGESVTKRKLTNIITLMRIKTMRNILGNDLDNTMSSLLSHLQKTKLKSLVNMVLIKHTYSLLRFNCTEIARKVRSMSDAQRLIDFLVYLIDEKYILSQFKPDGMSKATRLVLNIFIRIPVLPRSLFLKKFTSGKEGRLDLLMGIQPRCQAAMIWKVLDHNYVFVEMNLQGRSLTVPTNYHSRQYEWQRVLPLDSITIMELVLELARAVHYLHSMGISPTDKFHQKYVYLDLDFRPRIRINPECLTLINPFIRCASKRSLYGDSVFAFGCFFYAVYFNTEVDVGQPMEERRRTVAKRPSEPKIPEYAWQLIQRCCDEDPKNRPTIGEVVNEMETWQHDNSSKTLRSEECS